MTSLDLTAARRACANGRITWRKHALQRMAERNISRDDALAVIQDGERIIDYQDDRPFPSALMLADVGGRPLHVVVAFDKDADMAYVITAYEPTTEEFEEDLRTRRNRK